MNKRRIDFLKSLTFKKLKTEMKRGGFTITGHDFDKKTRGTLLIRAMRPLIAFSFFSISLFMMTYGEGFSNINRLKGQVIFFQIFNFLG